MIPRSAIVLTMKLPTVAWLFRAMVGMFAVFPVITSAESRHWKDASGLYTVKASFVTADDKLVVLEKDDGELEILKRQELSPTDRLYVAEQLAHEANDQEADDSDPSQAPSKSISTWHLRDGRVIKGSLVGFGSQRMVVQRDRGELWVNGYKIDKLPSAYDKVLPSVVSAIDGVSLKDLKELESHLAGGGGGPFEYVVQGVQLQLDEGGSITIPLALLSSSDAKEVAPNFARWKAAETAQVSDQERDAVRSRERLVLDSYARLRTNEAIAQRKLKMLELGLLRVDTGIVEVWEVTLMPRTAYGYPRTVVVSARDSLTAQQLVQQRYPNWQLGPVRKLSN